MSSDDETPKRKRAPRKDAAAEPAGDEESDKSVPQKYRCIKKGQFRGTALHQVGDVITVTFGPEPPPDLFEPIKD